MKKGYSWSEQVGIVITALVENGKTELIEWVKEVCSASMLICAVGHA